MDIFSPGILGYQMQSQGYTLMNTSCAVVTEHRLAA
jgi:hypothetical protein